MNNNPLLGLKKMGQHVWLDNLSRELLKEGTLQRLITEDGIDGLTSNPAIFQKSIAGGAHYKEDLERMHGSDLSPEARYEALVIPDIRAACDLLLPAYVSSSGTVGYVSLEISPSLANDAQGSIAAAQRLHLAVRRANLLIKLPGTPAGLQAFEALTASGMSVNVTLIFSLAQYELVVQAYLRGALSWLESGGDTRKLRSVASVFLSRVDTLVDKRLDAIGSNQALALKGGAGIALAKVCYQKYQAVFQGPDFALLRLAHIRPQTLLWASTGSKNPAASDVHYVEPLIGTKTITTLPDATLAAFRDHGCAKSTLTEGADAAKSHIAELAELGVDLKEVGETLQIDGVKLFAEAYESLLGSVQG